MTPDMERYLLNECRNAERERACAEWRRIHAVEHIRGTKHTRTAADSSLKEKEHRSLARRVASEIIAKYGTGTTILESKGIKVTCLNENEETFYSPISIRCNSWLCSDCRKIKGHKLRQRLFECASLFKVPRLYTITVNRAWFESPEAAYDYVMKNKFIARLLTKEMGTTLWIWVLEAQEKNGDGWPHWHILVDVGNLPGMWYNANTKQAVSDAPEDKNGWRFVPHFFDLNKVHKLLRKWKVGEQCYLSVKKEKFSNPEHAISYITKYLIKPPHRGFPEWMLKRSGIRFYQPSRALGSMGTTKIKADDEEEQKEKKPRRNHTPLERVAECGLKMLFRNYSVNGDHFCVTAPSWGIKKELRTFPGVKEIKDFSFESKKAFSRLGFRDIQDVRNCIDFWKSPEFGLALIQKIIEERKSNMLSSWKYL